MRVSKVVAQVVVSAFNQSVSEVVKANLIASRSNKEEQEFIASTFAAVEPVQANSKFTAKFREYRSDIKTCYDSDDYFDVNVIFLPSGDLMLIISEYSVYPHELETVDFKGFTIQQDPAQPTYWLVLKDGEEIKINTSIYSIETAEDMINYFLSYGRWLF